MKPRPLERLPMPAHLEASAHSAAPVDPKDPEVRPSLAGYRTLRASTREPMDQQLRLAIATAEEAFDGGKRHRPYVVRSPKGWLPDEALNAVYWTKEMIYEPGQVPRALLARPLHFITRDAHEGDDTVGATVSRLEPYLERRVVVVESHRNDSYNRVEFKIASTTFDASVPVPAADHERDGDGATAAEHSPGAITVHVEQGHGPGRNRTFVPAGLEHVDELKGMETLAEYVGEQRSAAGAGGRAFGADRPKGVMLVGPPGTGKSRSAEVVARSLGRPLYRLSGADFAGSYEGQSERNLAAILAAFKGKEVVLHIDEVEKLFPDATVKTQSNGVQEGCLQVLLPFMAENESVYFVFTSNGATVAPELIRAGRLDATFYVGLPERASRGAIVDAALVRRGWKASAADLEKIAAATQGYSGAELTQIVKNAIQRVNHRTEGQGTPTNLDLLAAVEEITPASRTHRATLDKLRAWATDVHAREAGGPRTEQWLPVGGILEHVASTESIEALGGFGAFKRWMDRQASITQKDVDHHQLARAKGMILVGIPGAGKTMAAQIAANRLGRPLLRMRFSKLLEDASHGAAERNMRNAIREIKEAGQTVVLLDEFDKMIELRHQSPLAAAELLDFMNSQTDTFFAASANDLSKVPPEFLRTGRFDKTWFVDLPTHKERKAVFDAVLSGLDKRNIEVYGRDLDVLADASAGFTPAEIRASVLEAMTVAAHRWKRASRAERASRSRLADASDIVRELHATVPESIRMGDRFHEMREAARALGAPVSDEQQAERSAPNPIGFVWSRETK